MLLLKPSASTENKDVYWRVQERVEVKVPVCTQHPSRMKPTNAAWLPVVNLSEGTPFLCGKLLKSPRTHLLQLLPYFYHFLRASRSLQSSTN